MPSPALAKIRGVAFDAFFYAWTALLLIVGVPFAPFLGERRMRRYAAFWQKGALVILRMTTGIHHVARGLEHLPPEPVIVAAKHQAAWETLYFHTVRPDMVIGLKRELGRIPIFGWYLRLGGNIFIDRGGAARALRSLIDGARAAVERGCSILIFPEGTRRPPGAPPDYKPGVAALYAALNIPVVPVALNSGLYWRRGRFDKHPGTITVEFLEPIPPGLSRRDFMARLEERIEGRCDALLLERPGGGQPGAAASSLKQAEGR